MKLSWQLEEQVFKDDLEGQNMSIWRQWNVPEKPNRIEILNLIFG